MAIPTNKYADITAGAVVVYRGNAYVVKAVSADSSIVSMHEAHGNNLSGIPFTDPELHLLYKAADVPAGFTTMAYIHGTTPLQIYL
jgi:hypothetical protein